MPGSGTPIAAELRRLAAVHRSLPGNGSATLAEAAFEPARARRAGMTRRRFVEWGVATGGAALASCIPLRDDPPPTIRAGRSRPRVVVVGAGLAGLTSAYRLARHGIEVVVYEAAERVGGRCWTARGFAGGQTSEHGGEFVDARHIHLRALARELGLSLVDLWAPWDADDRSILFLDGDARARRSVYRDFEVVLDRLRDEDRRIGGYRFDQAGPEARRFDATTVGEWLEANVPGGPDSLLGRALKVSVVSFFGLDPEALSAISLLEAYVRPYRGANERFAIEGGSDRLIDGLMAALPRGAVRRRAPLTALWRRGGAVGMRFEGEARSVLADRVILALPFTTLRNVEHDRAGLSARKRRCITRLAMATNSKLHLQFDRALDRVGGWSGEFVSDRPQFESWNSTLGQAREPAIVTVYTGGAAGAAYRAPRAHGRAPGDIVRSALDALERGVAGVETAFSGRALLDSWVDDPWVRGSYAAFGPGQYTDYWGFVGRAEGALHFAGEHTSVHSQGYLNGAVESGERAAREVLAALGVR